MITYITTFFAIFAISKRKNKMNADSEQLTAEYNIVVDKDTPLSHTKQMDLILSLLGNNVSLKTILGRKVVLFEYQGRKTIILTKAITYLGNPHPVFKKRIQIPYDWISYSEEAIENGYDVRFVGIYHYKGFSVFVDFEKDTYLRRQCNNSSAHVYVNDLYQGATKDYFHKTDNNGNVIHVISLHFLKQYMEGKRPKNHLVNIFEKFNQSFVFGTQLTARDAITEMRQRGWSQWKQAEWVGWYLEYRFSEFVKPKDIAQYICYTALSHKKADNINIFDFDLFFPIDAFYGDLKASDIEKHQTPGNDQEAFVNCVNRYGRFWYVIYEHSTEKDSNHNFEATKFRNQFIHKECRTPVAEYDEMSYHRRMKHSVVFKRMFILELNRINFHQVLSEFNQGHQPDGSPRAKKFIINKQNIENFVVFRYEWE